MLVVTDSYDGLSTVHFHFLFYEASLMLCGCRSAPATLELPRAHEVAHLMVKAHFNFVLLILLIFVVPCFFLLIRRPYQHGISLSSIV